MSIAVNAAVLPLVGSACLSSATQRVSTLLVDTYEGARAAAPRWAFGAAGLASSAACGVMSYNLMTAGLVVAASPVSVPLLGGAYFGAQSFIAGLLAAGTDSRVMGGIAWATAHAALGCCVGTLIALQPMVSPILCGIATAGLVVSSHVLCTGLYHQVFDPVLFPAACFNSYLAGSIGQITAEIALLGITLF